MKCSGFPAEGVYMKRLLLAPSLILSFLLILSACAPAPSAALTSTPVPLPELSPTREVPGITPTPVESAFAAGPTAAPLDDIIRTHTVTFETPDGALITGELYGSGKTAVVFSVMGNCKPGWREFAWLTAAQGLMVLTYQWRDCGPSGPTDEAELIQNFVNDARGAINFVRAQGAEEIMLAGASLGGLASAKLAIESQASGIIVLASPLQIPGWDFKIEAAELNTDIPKLFLTAENDHVVPLDDSRALYDLAAEPKEWQTYPGNEHGTDLFDTDIREEVQHRILGFILEIASTK
jgi:pimeloyl-ACP methyl ester carboxylesterase